MRKALTLPGTKAQAELLRELARHGEVTPEAEEAAGCKGAAFVRVLQALKRRGWIADSQRPLVDYDVTEAGHEAIASMEQPRPPGR